MSDPRRRRLDNATAELEPPFAVVDLDAFWANAADMERRAAGKPIRLASKSVRCRALQEKVLARSGFQGTLAFTLSEALWLAQEGFDDLVVAYPTVDRDALRALAELPKGSSHARLSLMVDSPAQLDLVEAAVGEPRHPIEVCLELLDAGLWLLDGRVRIGAKRSPVHTPEQAAALAREIVARPHFKLVGMMAYESQVAGVGDAPRGRRLRAATIRGLQKRSVTDLASRRGAAVAAVQEVLAAASEAPLRFINGGGTGSLESTGAESAVTEIAAGSGLYGPTLFDAYRAFQPEPAALFALPVVRKPRTSVATVLGGGDIPRLGTGRRGAPAESLLAVGADARQAGGRGEVQTPLTGAPARELGVGDRVWFRHAKAGELCERFDRLYLIEGEGIVEEVPTYRGEGKCFL